MIRRFSTLIMILAPFVLLNLITIFCWSHLPRDTPLSWNGSRNILFLMPGYYLLTAIALRVLTLSFPASSNASNTSALNYLLGGVGLFFLMLHLKNLLIAWTLKTMPHDGFAFMAMNLLMTFLGLSFLASTPNPVLGIPTPWARASEENWRKTHKLAGKACVLSGLFLQSHLLSSQPIVPALSMIGIILGSVIYSYQLHKGSRDSVAS